MSNTFFKCCLLKNNSAVMMLLNFLIKFLKKKIIYFRSVKD